MPDGGHDDIIMWLVEKCMQQRPDLWLYRERGLRTEAYRKGRAARTGRSRRVSTSGATASGPTQKAS